MCIRDSLSSKYLKLTPKEILVAGLLRDGKATKEIAEMLNAVSYTHLRAHETVLDLVCRLLLEKKKNKKNNYTYIIII